MKISLLRIGNSKGVILPKPLLSQLNLTDKVELEVTGDAIVLRRPRRKARAGWAKASQALAVRGNDELVWPEFSNAEDEKLTW